MRGRAGRGGYGGRGRGDKPADSQDFYEAPPGSELTEHYTVQRLIGTGTFSRCFEVIDKRDQQHYACKLMHPTQQYIQYSSDARKEGELLARLAAEDADGAAGMLRFKESFAFTDGQGRVWWCLILELLPQSLFDFIQQNRNLGMDISVVQAIARQLLQSLAFLHARGITHTDIKHKNIQLVNVDVEAVTGVANFPAQTRLVAETRRVTRYLHLKVNVRRPLCRILA
eukprot:TRINITY_DN27036_c0_g1_i2.p1 TRINITY_DN27036_c0_g1~~TRINITY_DN27036_c0_g1_i2.p1  ORF type:complete len:227 (+),score=40.99 TRINITY_DN27036_c0_g1_i2:30-710(+)